MVEQKKQIIELLAREKRPISISEIAKKSGIQRHAVARNLEVLEILGHVRKIQMGNAKKYILVKSLPVSGFIDISSDPIVIINHNLEIQYLNNAACQYFSLSPSRIIGEKLSLGTLPLISHQDILRELENYSFEKVIKKMYQSEQGSWFEITILGISLLFSPNLIAIIATDISERKKAEEQIQNSERLYRLLADNMTDVVWIYDIGSAKFTYMSPSVNPLLGYTPEELLQKEVREVLTEESYHLLLEKIPEYISDCEKGIGNPYQTTRIDQIHRDGSVIPTEIVTSFLRNSDGEITRILGSSRNISDRVIIEEQLKKSERHFRLLVETTKYNLSILDPVTLLHRYVSPSVFNILGYTSEEFLQIPYYQIVDPSQSESLKKLSGIRLRDYRANPEDNTFHKDEFHLIAKDGSTVWIESTYRFVLNEETGEPEIIGVSRDITEKKEERDSPMRDRGIIH
jgi:PAS domain S-box-containing protein